tara:strand:+ start:265 stop:393 length:129 start_codon:yes stop_codon:yes gene_type:complete
LFNASSVRMILATYKMGHAMVIIAYDDDKYGGAFQILNSYGT